MCQPHPITDHPCRVQGPHEVCAATPTGASWTNANGEPPMATEGKCGTCHHAASSHGFGIPTGPWGTGGCYACPDSGGVACDRFRRTSQQETPA